jgi:hypothetical protein
MEGCHWPFRKTSPQHWPKLAKLLLEGKPVAAGETTGWLTDYAGPLDESLKTVWKIVTDGDHGLPVRTVEGGALKDVPKDVSGLASAWDPATEAARKAIWESVLNSCGTTLQEALTIQARHSAGFMAGRECRRGAIGAAFTKTMTA